MEFKIV